MSVSLPAPLYVGDFASLFWHPPIDDATHYRGIPGALQYLTFTRPNIAHVVQHICLHMHDPQAPHLALVKGVLRYVKDTLDHGLMLHHSSSTGLMDYSLF
jgi:hypothetical protein